jgi:NADPH:quinone reductase-like Zn-dependent oxidoreductase
LEERFPPPRLRPTEEEDQIVKAVEVRGASGFDDLHVVSRPVPDVGPRDVLIRVRSASLNYRDLFLPLGTLPRTHDYFGRIPGSDGAGDVVAVGQDVTRVAPGDRVTVSTQIGWVGGPVTDNVIHDPGFTIDGFLAEYAVFDEIGVIKFPDYLNYDEAASLPCAAVSAWSTLTGGPAAVTPGQTVLVEGTGGVALFALQFARMFGARVFAITSSQAKADLLHKLGAEAVVDYRQQPEWHEQILDLTAGRGVDRVIDVVGGDTVARAARCTRRGGVISCVGFLGGRTGGIDPIDLVGRALNVTGYLMGNRTAFEAMLAAMEQHQIHPVLDRVFTLDDTRQAYAHLAAAQHIGKIMVRPGDDEARGSEKSETA